jgi:two-component system sensor histidine kinase BarA
MEINTLLAKTILRSELPHARFFIAKDGKEALSAAAEHKPDLIFMDIQMPGMDGYSASEKIRQHEINQKSKKSFIVALSADLNIDEKEKEHASAIDFFLSKPLQPAEVQKVLSVYYDQSPSDAKVPTDNQSSIPHFNFDSFKKRLAGNEVIIEQVFESAKYSLSENENELRTLLDKWDKYSAIDKSDLISKLSHKLHGLSLTIGFDRLSELSKKLHKSTGEEYHDQKQLITALLKELDILGKLDIRKYRSAG